MKAVRAAPADAQVDLHPVAATEDVALGGERDLVPVLLQLRQAAVVLLQVGRYAQEPGRAADQPDLVVTAPAAPVLDLQRGKRGATVIAPIDGGVVAVDQPCLEQGDEEPLRPAVLRLVGAVEDALVVEGEAEADHLLEHPLAAVLDPVGGRHFSLDRRHLGRQAEGIETEAEEDGVAASAAEAGVGVADRVIADVAHMEFARGERARGLDVDGSLPLGRGGRGKCVALCPSTLPGGLDLARVIARYCAAHTAHFPMCPEPTCATGENI